MTRHRVALATCVLCAAAVARDVATQSPVRPSDRQPIASATTAVLVDVVVRDRRGRPVTDLAAEDFTIAEDGVAQKVDSFTRVTRGGGIGVGVAWKQPNTTVALPPVVADPAVAGAPEEDSTVALVFDHLSAESLRLAQKATRDYVPMTGEWQGKIGVFATDPGIRVVQAYTSDPALVRLAVERVVPAATSAADQQSERTDDLIRRRAELRAQGQSAAGAGGGVSGPALGRAAAELGERQTELRLLQTELNLLRSFDHIDREHGGYDSALALLAVVRTLAYVPGRKAIVFFSEGLPVTPALSARLDVVIDAANRANVTTYTVDANGLRAKSALTTMRKEMDAFADERRFQNDTGVTRTEGPITMAFERVEDTLRIDSRTGLARLAEDTGGFLVEQTNDLSSAFRRIDEDNRFHYLLTYSPKNVLLDGKFREIRVNVRRSGLQVFARKGYRALPSRAPDAGGYEGPALDLLDRTPLPKAFAVHAAGFSFPDPARPGLSALLVHVRTDALRFVVDPVQSTYSAQAAIVVRIRDGRRREVHKVSQQYVLAGASKDVEAARHGEILFYRDADLPPGVYTVETIVFDANANDGSARVATLTVPAPEASAPAMSSLVLVKRVEEVKAGTPGVDAAGPLYVGETLLYPNLGEPYRKSDTRELPFYFALYGDTRGAIAHAQLLRNGLPLAEARLDLPPPTASRIQHLGRLPIDALAPGTYELRIRVVASRGEMTRSAFFTLHD